MPNKIQKKILDTSAQWVTRLEDEAVSSVKDFSEIINIFAK